MRVSDAGHLRAAVDAACAEFGRVGNGYAMAKPRREAIEAVVLAALATLPEPGPAPVDAEFPDADPEPVPKPALCTLEQAREIAGNVCAHWGINYPPKDAAEQLREFINAELGLAPAESAPHFCPGRQPGHMRVLGVEIAPDGSGYRASLAGGFSSGDLEYVVEAIVREVTGFYTGAHGVVSPRLRQPEPVPGAAVRALVQKCRDNALALGTARGNGLVWKICGDDIEAALRADGLASVELPTREELARGLGKSYARAWGPGASDFETACDRVREGLLAEADYVLSLLARRPATDEAEVLEELRAKLSAKIHRIEALHDSALRRVTDLESQLAARPEPVVIDEALARRLQYAWNDEVGCDAQAMLAALHRVFGGDRASVSVPQGDYERLCLDLREERVAMRQLRSQIDLLRADLEKTRRDLSAADAQVEDTTEQRDQLRAELEAERAKLDALAAEMHAELEKTRGELEACKRFKLSAEAETTRCGRALAALREQHEALRAACEPTDAEQHAYANVFHYGTQHADTVPFARYYSRIQAALKPAPAEAEPVVREPREMCPAPDAGTEETNAEYAARKAKPPPPEQVEADPLAALTARLAKVEAVAHAPQPVVAPEEFDALAAKVDRLERQLSGPMSPARTWLRIDAFKRFIGRTGHDGSTSVHVQALKTAEELDAMDAATQEALDARKVVGNAG